MKSDVCYIQDPETGRFMGSKPGCSHSGGEVSEKLLQRFEKEKGVIKQRVDAVAASGKLTPKDSELKGKAQQLLYKVKTGDLSYQEGLYELSKGNAQLSRYAKAEVLLDRDTGYWKDILKKGGSDQVDTLLSSFVGAPVTGVADYVLNASNSKSGVQQISDQKPLDIPSRNSRKDVEKELQERLDNITRRSVDFKKLNEGQRFDKDKFTKYSGNQMETNATYYNLNGSPTTSGVKYDKYAFTGAMQPIDVGKLHGGKYEYAKVTNTANGQSVIIKINDCGPRTPIKVKGQDKPLNMLDPTKALDLSVAAYAKITHKDDAGKLQVKVEFLSKSAGQAQYEEQARTVDMGAIRKRVDKISPNP